ncbi:MAG: hypothetical protein J2P18_12065, partial [Nocardia sp.]|nr:hypothetical protein [Nocardia sp.]
MTEQSAKSRSTSHILQHTAVVFAGMASIGLTVGAGTYIGHQIGAGELPEVIGSGIPAVIGTGAAIDSNLHRALEPSAPHAKNPAPSRVSQVPRAATGTPIPNPNADRIIAPSADPLPVTSVVPASTSNENASVASSFG